MDNVALSLNKSDACFAWNMNILQHSISENNTCVWNHNVWNNFYCNIEIVSGWWEDWDDDVEDDLSVVERIYSANETWVWNVRLDMQCFTTITNYFNDQH